MQAPSAVRPEGASDADDALLSDSSDGFRAPKEQGRRLTAAAMFVTALVAAAALVYSQKAASGVAGRPGATTLLEEVKEVTDDDAGDAEGETAACVAPGENCVESGCCIDGGAKGYQCYGKNKDWGECFDAGNCTEGVHEGEKDGTWNAQGVFELAKWGCKEIGKVSKPACWSFDADKCPSDRCDVKDTKECVPKCSTFSGADGCWQSGNCMWSDDKCQDGCWETKEEEDCTGMSRCQWLVGPKSSRCTLACHIHGGLEDCPSDDKCMWDSGKCQKDPCSAPGEDCTHTKCCSLQRGALGMKCVEKMKFWATCMDSFNGTKLKDWSGKVLGPRAFQKGIPGKEEKGPKLEAGCSWAGQDCSDTKLCCNKGFTCNRKDKNFAGCVQTNQVSTWSEESIPLPEGWSGEPLGESRGEWQVEATPEGQDMSDTTFYCIMAILPDSPEVDLLNKAKENGGSIFACNATSVYRAWQTDAATWDTGDSGASVVNTAVFLKVMEYVKEDRLYLNYDWTIKVDADCVFLPERLRSHLWALRPPPNQAMYVKNNHLEGLGNDGFLGAIEVFSREAMKKYMDNAEDCGKFLGTNSGEDGFFKGCMDAIGVGFIMDSDMFKPNYDPAICTNGMYAAYHPIKYPSHWQRCWDIATGKICQGLTYDCGGDLDPPVTSAGVR